MLIIAQWAKAYWSPGVSVVSKLNHLARSQPPFSLIVRSQANKAPARRKNVCLKKLRTIYISPNLLLVVDENWSALQWKWKSRLKHGFLGPEVQNDVNREERRKKRERDYETLCFCISVWRRKSVSHRWRKHDLSGIVLKKKTAM